MSRNELRSVDLPEHIVEWVEKRLSRTEFDSTGEYVTFVMEEVRFQVEEQTDDTDSETVNEAEVKDRLRALGYLDN